MKNLFTYLSAVSLLAMTACGDGFKTTDNGLKYKIHTTNEGETAKIGDLLDLHMVVLNEKDSAFFDSHITGSPIKLELSEPTFKGGLEEGFAMLRVGDSATFIVPADSFFEKTSQEPFPSFVTKGSKLTFRVKLEKKMSKEEYDNQISSEASKMATDETVGITKYLADNNITAQALASGLYYIPVKEGKGAAATPGKTVGVHYTGKLLNGEVFDTSVGRGEPLEFNLGQGMVIPGWEEGISMMKTGVKANLIIPSGLAYGPQGYGNKIPPYSTLIFEVELVSVK